MRLFAFSWGQARIAATGSRQRNRPGLAQDQIPNLRSALTTEQGDTTNSGEDELLVVEVQQFQPPKPKSVDGFGAEIKAVLEKLELKPDRFLHFGQDPELPAQDTLEFSRLEAWNLSLQGHVWDPDSLSSFWFELVNGAYGMYTAPKH